MSRTANDVIVWPVLAIAGLAGTAIGILMLFFPVEFHGTAGIALGRDVSLLNEMRAAGGGVLMCGLFVLAGAFRRDFAFPSALLAASVYSANGLARIFSMTTDGPPSTILMIVAAAEIGMGLLCANALTKVWR
jgi:hypothetical protein